MYVAEERMGATRVKICGVTRREDARQAAAAGADYVGAILSPGFDRSVEAAAAARFVPGGEVALVAVTVDAGVDGAAAAAREAGAAVIQLHGRETPGELRALRGEGGWRLWKAVRVRRADDLLSALDRWHGVADGLVVEGFLAGHAGGAGATFPWDVLERLRERVPRDLALVVAGGLAPANVAEAVARLSPDVVDVSSGVESRRGVKDPERVRAFIEQARLAAGGVAPASACAPRESGP